MLIRKNSNSVQTIRFQIGDGTGQRDHPSIRECCAILKRGGLVAIPTETVYGLAANALDAAAVKKIFEAKQRPAWDPLIVHVSSLEMVPRIASRLPEPARKLAERFWPGPLTLLLPRSPDLPSIVTAGRDTVAVRMPGHPVAQSLIAATDLPLAAPSANRFGHVSPTTADHVLGDLDGRIDAVLDAGPTTIGIESTVLDPSRTPPLILRLGGITREQIEDAVGRVEIYSAAPEGTPEALVSPGLPARHYAPGVKLVLTEGTQHAFRESLREHVQQLGERSEYVGVMAPDQWLDQQALATGGVVIFDWGTWGEWPQLAHNLFTGLRYLDKPGVGVILCPLPPPEGLALTIRDRLLRGAR